MFKVGFCLIATLATITVPGTYSFVPNSVAVSCNVAQKTFLSVKNVKSCVDTEGGNRRSFLSTAGSAVVASIISNFGVPDIANAFGKLEKINKNLSSYGLPTINKVPDGFSPLLEFFGRGRNRTPLLVNFLYPDTWVVTLPSNDVNGEDGTIQAGEYAKGDTATLFVNNDLGKVDVTSQGKEFFQNAIIKAISQKGDSIYQDFKVKKTEIGSGNYLNGQKYVIVDFSYTLLTGAGFEVDRKGVASVTSEGNGVQLLWTASTAVRYKKTEKQLRTIADSFRVYSEGLDLSTSRIDYEEI